MDHRRDDEKLPHNSFRSQNPKPLNAPSRFHKLRLSLVREKRLRTIGPPLRIPISESHQHCVFPKPGNDSSDTNDKASTVNAKDVFEEDVEPPSPKSYLFTERDNSESVYAGEKEAVVDAKDSSETVEKRKRKADTESQENSISVSFNMESLQDQSENDGYVGLGEQEYDPLGALRIDLGANFNNKQPLSSSGANTNIKSDDDHLHKRQSEHSCLKSNASKSVVTDRSRHVQFFTPESSSGCTGMGFQNQSSSSGHSDGGIGASHDLQLQMKCERQTNPSIGGKSVLLSNIREDSFQKAYEKVATDVDVRNLQTYLNSLSLTENHGGQVVSNSGQCFTNQEQSARQELYHRTLKDVAGLRKMVNDLKPTKIVIDKAGIVKPSNHAIESSSHSASTYVGASSASTQEPYSLASSCVTQNDIGNCDIQNDRKGETLKANEDLKSSHHCSERSRRQDLGDCLGTHESLFSSSCLTSANSAGAPVQCTSGTVTMLSAGPGSGSTRGQNPDTNANNNFQGEVHNVRHSGSQAASRTLEEKYCERHLLSSKESQVKGQSHMTATILEKSVQQSSSRAMSDKPVHRETNINTKKHSDAERFFKVNEKLYQKLGKIGSGGSSEVHKVIASDCTIYALKRIKLKGRDYPTAHGFFQEIEYLNKLRGKNNIIQLIDHEVTDKTLFNDVTMEDPKVKDGKITKDAYIYMVLEYGEIDLAHMLMKKWKELELENKQIDEDWLRYYWKQILKAVDTIHEERIVHSDLKPANFLLVKGVLKLIDFGIAKAIQSDTTNIQRDSQVGTLNYMSPEAFMCNDLDDNGNIIKCGRPSDIWSLGCILYQMVYGKTPFADYKSFWEKYKVITNKNHPIRYGPVSNLWLLDIMKKCLAWNRNDRLRIPQLLEHPFLKPPTVPVSFSPEEQLCKSISEISHLYESDLQVQSLCEQLHSLSEQLRACIQSKRP